MIHNFLEVFLDEEDDHQTEHSSLLQQRSISSGKIPISFSAFLSCISKPVFLTKLLYLKESSRLLFEWQSSSHAYKKINIYQTCLR